MRQYYIAVPVSLIENMCKALSEYELTDGDWKACFDKIHDACVDIDAFCRDKLNVEALDQEPCEDAISRQIISDYVESHIQEINTGYGDLNKHTNKILRMIVDYIESMPPVTSQPNKWIPVSERYPEDGQRALVDYCDEDAGIMLIRFNANGYHGFKAWMPLPEPYKASPTGAGRGEE